jgi:epoxide hydrolase-like predicted phosphatase
MIKAIIFDFGNVICKFDNNIFLKKISNKTNKTIKKLNEIIYIKSSLPQQYETGLITSDEFFEKIKILCNLKITKDEFITAYTNIFTPIKTTFNLIQRLKPNYKLALLSNTREWDFNYGIKPTEIFDLFDVLSLSFRVKAMKPDSKMFFDVLDKLRLSPEECVSIDDIKEYANRARQLGFHAVHYTSYNKLLQELKELNVKI